VFCSSRMQTSVRSSGFFFMWAGGVWSPCLTQWHMEMDVVQQQTATVGSWVSVPALAVSW
jgi:hypothetical protein